MNTMEQLKTPETRMRAFSPVFLNDVTKEWELVENEDRVVMVEFSNGKWIRYEEANRYKSAIEQLSHMLRSDDFTGLLKIVAEYVKEVNRGKTSLLQ